MTQFNETGQRDTVQFERLNSSFEIAREMAQEAADERAAFWDQSNALQRQYLRDLMPELEQLGRLQTRLLVELRRELDVGGDIEVFEQIMRKQMERAERAVNDFDFRVYCGDAPPP